MDYVSFTVNVTFTPGGDDINCFNVTIMEDQVFEDTENFTLVIEEVSPGAMGQVLDRSALSIFDSNGKEQTFSLLSL